MGHSDQPFRFRIYHLQHDLGFLPYTEAYHLGNHELGCTHYYYCACGSLDRLVHFWKAEVYGAPDRI